MDKSFLIEKYQKLRWKLLNLNGKIPINKEWQNKDVFNIEKEGNIGVQTGKVSGIIVVDIDKVDTEILSKVAFYLTPCAITGRGFHYYFKYQEGIRNSVGKIAEKVDLRSDNGYVVIPPSIHPDTGKPYQWTIAPWECELAEFPKELKEKLNEPRISVGFREFTTPILQGGRNNYLTSLAGSMRRKGLSFNAIFTALYETNMERCIPPLPESEVRTIAESISKYSPSFNSVSVYNTVSADSENALNNSDRLMEASPIPTQIYRYSSLKDQSFPKVETIPTGIHGLDSYLDGGLGVGETSFLIAKQGTGKTHLACFIGSNARKKGFNVLHVFYEDMLGSIKNKYDAKFIAQEYDADIFFLDATKQPVTLNEIERQIKEINPGLVIIDYFFRIPSQRGLGESRFEVRDTVMTLANIARNNNCHILVLDHILISYIDYSKEPWCYRLRDDMISEAKMYKGAIADTIIGMVQDKNKTDIWITGIKHKRYVKDYFNCLKVEWDKGNFIG